MCMWGHTPIAIAHHNVAEDEPLTAYKVLGWSERSKLLRSLVRAEPWRRMMMSADVSPLVTTHDNGVYCFKNPQGCGHVSAIGGVVVKLAIWGDVAQYRHQPRGVWRRGYTPSGFRAQHARIVQIVGPHVQLAWGVPSISSQRAYEQACAAHPGLRWAA